MDKHDGMMGRWTDFFQIYVKQREKKIKIIYQYPSSLFRQNIYSLQKDPQSKEGAGDFWMHLNEAFGLAIPSLGKFELISWF